MPYPDYRSSFFTKESEDAFATAEIIAQTTNQDKWKQYCARYGTNKYSENIYRNALCESSAIQSNMVLDLLKRSTIRNGLIDTLLNNKAIDQDLIISIVNNRGGELSSDNMNLIKKHSYYTTQCEQILINKNKDLRNGIVELLTH